MQLMAETTRSCVGLDEALLKSKNRQGRDLPQGLKPKVLHPQGTGSYLCWRPFQHGAAAAGQCMRVVGPLRLLLPKSCFCQCDRKQAPGRKAASLQLAPQPGLLQCCLWRQEGCARDPEQLLPFPDLRCCSQPSTLVSKVRNLYLHVKCECTSCTCELCCPQLRSWKAGGPLQTSLHF